MGKSLCQFFINANTINSINCKEIRLD